MRMNLVSFFFILDPWTETSHTFSIYENPKINNVDPKECKTSQIVEVNVWADPEKPFSQRKYFLI